MQTSFTDKLHWEKAMPEFYFMREKTRTLGVLQKLNQGWMLTLYTCSKHQQMCASEEEGLALGITLAALDGY